MNRYAGVLMDPPAAPKTARDEAIDRVIDFHTRPRKPVKNRYGRYVVGETSKREAICIHFDRKANRYGDVDSATLREMYNEARAMGLSGRIHVHAATTTVAETATFRFYQED